MMNDPWTYFKYEKLESLLFVLVGIVAIAVSVWLFLKFKDNFYRGITIPLILIGLIQLTVGGSVYFRTDKQVSELKEQFESNRSGFSLDEGSRMKAVMTNFKYYKWIESAFILSGVLLLVLLNEKNFWYGLGLGLVIQGGFMIVLDIFAERRGEAYLDWVNSLT